MKSKDQTLLEEAYEQVSKKPNNPFNQIDIWFREIFANQTFPDGSKVVDENISYSPKEKDGKFYYSPPINSKWLNAMDYGYYYYVYSPDKQSFLKHTSASKMRLTTADDVKKDIASEINSL